MPRTPLLNALSVAPPWPRRHFSRTRGLVTIRAPRWRHKQPQRMGGGLSCHTARLSRPHLPSDVRRTCATSRACPGKVGRLALRGFTAVGFVPMPPLPRDKDFYADPAAFLFSLTNSLGHPEKLESRGTGKEVVLQTLPLGCLWQAGRQPRALSSATAQTRSPTRGQTREAALLRQRRREGAPWRRVTLVAGVPLRLWLG